MTERNLTLPPAPQGVPDRWKPMASAPKDGTAILVLIPDSDIPKAVRWRNECWEMTWDGHQLSEFDQPRYWMFCPADPDRPTPAAPQAEPQQPAPAGDRDMLAKRLIGEVHEADAIATAACQGVAELPDRNSPEDWPEAMLVTHEELHMIVREAVIDAQTASTPVREAALAAQGGQEAEPTVLATPLRLVVKKLERFDECAEDSDSGGCDIGRPWFDTLTHLGLLARTQRSPAIWTMTHAGRTLLRTGGFTHPPRTQGDAFREYSPPTLGQGESDNPYVDDNDANEPSSRATRWRHELLALERRPNPQPLSNK